jgi:hypothetical protein
VNVRAPARRLAVFRVLLGTFVTLYLLIRLPVFLELGHRSPNRFVPVGVFRIVGHPMPTRANDLFVAATVASGVLFTLGWRFRITGPTFALCVLVVASHRSSWGQLLHFENLMTLHLVVVGLSKSSDAWSLDARRRRSSVELDLHNGHARYGWPLRLAAVITVTTYVIAGVAKIRYGGLEWMTGETLRNHIAYSATRLDLLGGNPAPLAELVVKNPQLLRPAAALSVAIELVAPIALFGGRWRTTWVVAAWLMHVGIYATMFVGFPSPLFLVAFAPMFELERFDDYARRFAQCVRRQRPSR